ncbi:hypothetical protein [Streptomyces sp. NBC_01217]|uniref:hypothetical protein n=1 Tax=Streptomyces sp. NBC_01217 TaxID=2903779 RepID=UPI002E1205C4|nr:hypothetical protein OG507_23530 [Streptomyces sp. NBC_01217]
MTQSGQGDEQQLPAVRPAHEGVVLPAGGGEPWIPGGHADQAAPAGGQPWGQPWGPQAAHQDASSQQQAHGQGAYGQEQYGHEQYGQPTQMYGQPRQPLPPVQPRQPQQSYAQPLPPEAVPGMGMGGDADATQYIAPVPAGPAPRGLPPESPAEATQFLAHGAPQGYQQGGDAEATQYIPPVPGGAPYGIRPGMPGDRQPPAEFDNLFRNDGPAGATQQMPQVPRTPRFDSQPQPQQQAPYQPVNEGPYGQPEQPVQRKKRAHVTLIAAVVVGCAVVGLGAGALMSGGDDKGADNKEPVAAASSPAGQPSTQGADAAKPQAEALDKLLADSNNSRSAVIGAVEKTKNCTDLDQARTDLQGAAQQRRDLVTRLQELNVDKLPNHAQLTASLTKAWQASAAADEHYAAWAGQAKDGKKVCRHGKARPTAEMQKASAQSVEASKAKQEASGLWNSIASKYGLTKRTATDL